MKNVYMKNVYMKNVYALAIIDPHMLAQLPLATIFCKVL